MRRPAHHLRNRPSLLFSTFCRLASPRLSRLRTTVPSVVRGVQVVWSLRYIIALLASSCFPVFPLEAAILTLSGCSTSLTSSKERPQTILPSPSKKSSRSFRPSRYLHRRPSNSNTNAMDLSRPKIPVTITFFHPNTSPPVYVATSLTNPPWQVVEMDVKQERTPSGDLIFDKKFDAVEAGEYQYKFRLGPGDWWVCDDNAPTVSDGFGNSNNLLIVEPQDSLAEHGADASQEEGGLERVESAPEVWSRGTKQQRKPGKGKCSEEWVFVHLPGTVSASRNAASCTVS